MEKNEKKHSLVKAAGIMVLISVLLTWIIPQGVFQGSGISVSEITRVGIFDFFTYGLFGLYYFTVLVTFLFVLFAFSWFEDEPTSPSDDESCAEVEPSEEDETELEPEEPDEYEDEPPEDPDSYDEPEPDEDELDSLEEESEE